jgi:hypothetical protein
MKADRNAVPPSDDAPRDALQAECARQAREIALLDETVSVFRQGAHALSVENSRLRGELGTMRALAAHARSPGLDTDITETQLPLNARAAAIARAIVVEFLRERVPYGLLDRAKLVVSELIAESLGETATPLDRFVMLRVERSPTVVKLELDDPERGADVVGLQDPGWFGQQVMQAVSEAWGGERAPLGGTRTWARLELAGPSA